MLLKPFELPAVANIGLQLVHACEYMHSKQIIHTGVFVYVHVIESEVNVGRGGRKCNFHACFRNFMDQAGTKWSRMSQSKRASFQTKND